MDFIRNEITEFRDDHHDNNNQQDQDQFDGPSTNIAPGQVEEAVHYMTQDGFIDLSLLRFQINERNKGIGMQMQDGVESFLDIAVFEVSNEHCTSRNCDLSKYGVGSLAHFKGATYLNLCMAGRLILDHNIFEGHHTQLMIPREGPMPNHVKQGGKFSVPKGRYYEVLLANCKQEGQHVHVAGQVLFDFQDGPVEITNGSFAILTALAFLVFLSLSILAIRIDWGTRADYEYGRGFVSHEQLPTDDTEEDDQEGQEGGNDENENEHGETRVSLSTRRVITV